MDIEETALKNPEKIITTKVDFKQIYLRVIVKKLLKFLILSTMQKIKV